MDSKEIKKYAYYCASSMICYSLQKVPFLLGGALSMLLHACQPYYEHIKDQKLRDRVVACGVGFSDEAKAQLEVAYLKHKLNGDLSASFRDSAQSIILDDVPPQDRLKAYEDYIKCIKTP